MSLRKKINCHFAKQARGYFSPDQILKGDPEESMPGIRKGLNILYKFKKSFEEHQQKIQTYFKDNREPRLWNFNSDAIFSRFDKFTHLVETVVEFMDTYANFLLNMKDMDRRLGTIVARGFDDCTTLEAAFKIILMMSGLLKRPLIAKDFECKYPILMNMLNEELDTSKLIVEKQLASIRNKQERPFIHKNMPQTAGLLRWAHEIRERVGKPVTLFGNLNHPCVKSDNAELLFVKYDELMDLLGQFEDDVYGKWIAGVDEACAFNLGQPLITRNKKTNLISVNFDPKLVAVLREVKYVKLRQKEGIPSSAETLYAQNNTFFKFVANLDMSVRWYNKVRKEALDVEFPLIEAELTRLDSELQEAETGLHWKDEGVWEYIVKIRDKIHDLERRVQKSKDNVATIQNIMTTWNTTPLYERREEKTSCYLNLDNRYDRCAKRYAEIDAAGERIHGLLQENLQLLGASEDTATWKAYVDYVDEMVVAGFVGTVVCSLQYFLDNTDAAKQPEPLLRAIMELIVPEIVFSPAMEYGVSDSLMKLIEGLMNDVYKQASHVPRLSLRSGKSYENEMDEMEDLNTMREELMERSQSVMHQANEYKHSFNDYAYLWVDDRDQFMRMFLLYGRQVTHYELEAETAIPENPPTLEQFKGQIDSYEKIYLDAQNIEGKKLIDSWFLIYSEPFKQGLINTIKTWSFMFKQHLIDNVKNSMVACTACKDWKTSLKGLKWVWREVKEGDYDSLVKVMGFLGEVRERMAETDEMFEPLKQKIELLKTYNQEMPENVFLQLQTLPEMWANTKKASITTKQAIAPIQANEVMNIQRRVAAFDVTQHKYREKFRGLEFFRSSCKKPYDLLDQINVEIEELEAEMTALGEAGHLFAVAVPEYKQLRFCRKEIRFVKQLWDHVYVVSSSFDEWRSTPWKDINVEQMDMDCKKFAKDIRALDKEMRAWDVYTVMEDDIKNMITSLKAVHFVMDEHTVLMDLLKLNLHKYEEEVRTIVDKAVKETSMEKLLRELDVTWKQMEFEHIQHPRTGITLLRASEEVVETLEDNQSQVQNMMASKYIAFFLKEVSQWQIKLSTADQVVNIYMEVQRTWQHLESIFIGSEDIRNQLPEDSARFEMIDKKFKEIVKSVTKTKNVVKATNIPNLYEKLDYLQGELAKCEKALAEYLETKRLAFPRFYFVSSADLLDILSNGNSPPSVMKHLTKLFDSLAKLKLEKDSAGTELKSANGMWSKDGEYVALAKSCDLQGQVENWLNNVLDVMIITVRHEMSEAIVCYEDKARDEWLFDFPAQVALCGTQIWWTTEVNQAFARLEEGFENAMKDYNKKQIQQLNALINRLIGDLSKGDRQKIMTVCTIDVHARDVVAKMILQKVDSSQAFVWLSQLRHRWDDKVQDCFANICDAQILYSHEYLGNTPRLVITPLTDRCYITLTQSLHLIMGGAPAGPAGTGKTETTKDLGRALGIMVYVFNCSEQMDYKSVGNIYKGLAQSGTWGCFDEFNRIAVEVLSVIAVQVKSIQDAIRDKKPCAMVVPDFELICEIMLVAEGFIEARLLARKFITLYSLCKELLSKQDHYDWGLRAIKSVLVVAGALKRGDRARPEDQVLMRALRDFNVPKIVVEDMPVFMGLIGDLFPALDVPRKRDLELEKNIHKATVQVSLQPEDNFILKCVQLQELFEVRHSVFLLGPAGCGKSKVWTTLQRTYKNLGRKPTSVILDPKSVSNDELFGIINPATREWKDGLFAVVMRDLANMTGDGSKWIVLDGDIDPMWIESLNTVMDDNKILTLASNERIPLTPTMRLLFEISHLKTATPATVSRAGILFINTTDLGWNPFVQSWIESREVQTEKANLTVLFERYVPILLDVLKVRFKKITPIVEIAHVQMLCHLLECLLKPEVINPDSPKELYELYFTFACIWAFGGVLFQDQLTDHRVEFTKWWTTEMKAVKFPSTGTVFDYYIDPESKKFEPWTKLVPNFEFNPDEPLQATLVHTAETTRTRFFLDMLIAKKQPVMLVGNAGTGKTVLMQDKLNSLNKDEYMIANVPFNFYTTSALLQLVLEKPLEKKAGRNYGPPGTRRLIYFVDDLNMPEVDQYFTVQPHTFMRQHIDHKHWYDRVKLSLKEIHKTQYVACMNPTAGSFTIDPRLQRHFCVFAMNFPNKEALMTIYSSILSQHMALANFQGVVQRFATNLVGAALNLHTRIATSFLPTAIKFHYVFNLRDLSNIFQGILFSGADCAKTHWELVRLWLHESARVYRDKLVDLDDIVMYDKTAKDVVKKTFEDVDEEVVFKEPVIYCHFALGIGDPKYMPVLNWESLNKVLIEALDNYNELNAAMNLVLFEDAMMHICRINRILESPRGNALLIGVGGSGKQSLSRLSASISSLDVFQITLRKGYSITDLKLDLAELYRKAGIKSVGIMFLMTDSQVADEKFLVLINDLLASGEIPGLFTDDQMEEVFNGVKSEVKQAGMDETRENCWSFFIDKVRRLLKVVLCFSPVGNTLRVRSRKFPAVTNCTSIDWFHEWPEQALISVSARFLEDNEYLSPDARTCISKFMSFVHSSVNELSQEYMAVEKRYNYTTPKSFLEQITLYQNLLQRKFVDLQGSITRLENGLEKLRSTAAQVDDLKDKLAAQEVVVAQKNEDANKLIQVVGAEKEKVGKEKAIADEEEKKVSVITKEVQIKQEDCARDLAKAEPALAAAEAALNTLNKQSHGDESFWIPPAAVVNVTSAVMCLLAPKGKVPKDRSWKNAKATIMSKDPDFNPEFIAAKSTAAAGLCSWAINIVTYYYIYCDVEPKRIALQVATDELQAAQDKLKMIKDKVASLQATLAACQADFERATNEKDPVPAGG
ncbi:hypothetical protein C0Q70_01053 [Pomacea canaliculata]|uniref:AAA+ ATPase domain-containing protein n=1 Tax=Pomacea canaliculata TaxID=400727 RepID=A0A2T7PYF2_POMCA|nr:hypothetical protein C0Q70_01053 [Pomacea canaliculata]